MTLLDWVILAIFVVSLVTSAINGFFVELFSVVGLVAGVILAGLYYTRLAEWLLQYLRSVPGANAAAFLLIVVGVLIAAGIVGRVVRWLLRKVGLGWADRLLGVVIGAVKGVVLVTALAMIVTAFFPERSWVLQSRLLPYFTGAAHQGSVVVPKSLGERVRAGIRTFEKESPFGRPWSGKVAF